MCFTFQMCHLVLVGILNGTQTPMYVGTTFNVVMVKK